ncbi:MAG: anthranilate synthase component I family protein, partial [Flavobacteriales bacterium]
IVIEWFGSKGQVHFYSDVTLKEDIMELLIDLTRSNSETKETTPVSFESRVSKEGYLKKVNELKAEIQYGNIYEINFCQEFFTKQEIDPYLIYKKLNEISPTPYSCFGRLKNFYLMCASPEQYLQKTGNKIISKPIKGTIKRSSEFEEDELLKAELFNSEKDKSENVMIVDLVRNDLSKCAEKGSVKVDELFGVYSFPQVHQMISTVSARLKDGVSGVSAIKSSFPMGSMTGAPKIKAMELIEKEEVFKRGLYSGSVGYFNPEGDFNFNVVIRSLFYSPELTQLSFAIGGAITDGSNALDEYEESLLKAKAIFEVFN